MANPQEWARLGRELGLGAYLPTGTFQYGTSFKQLKRAMGPAPERPSFQHWLVASMADAAIELGQSLAVRRAEVAFTTGQHAEQAEWSRFADLNALAFDDARMKISGQIRGAMLEIALETEGHDIRTAMTVEFPRALDVAFMVLRSGVPGFLQGLFGQDIQVGHGR